jgi:hypothetical protein
MSIPISTEKRMLTPTEFEVVEQTHYPAIFEESTRRHCHSNRVSTQRP